MNKNLGTIAKQNKEGKPGKGRLNENRINVVTVEKRILTGDWSQIGKIMGYWYCTDGVQEIYIAIAN